MRLPIPDNSDIINIGLKPLIISNTRKLNMTYREHLKSFLITFFVAVAMVFLADIDKLSMDTLGDGALLGIVFGALRAGVKAVLALFVSIYSSR